jgi:hypothetical protein
MKSLFAIAAVLIAVQTQGQSVVVCESINSCRTPPPPYEVPALNMDTTDGGPVQVTVNFWYSHGCKGDPDLVSNMNLAIPYASTWAVNYLDPGPLEDGSEYSIIWMVDDCPATACNDGTISVSPDICL